MEPTDIAPIPPDADLEQLAAGLIEDMSHVDEHDALDAVRRALDYGHRIRDLSGELEDRLRRQAAEHEAYRPEVVAEIAVHLDEETDWEAVAAWCGGTIQNQGLPSGDVASSMILANGEVGWNGCWITLDHAGQFRIRSQVDGPTPRAADADPTPPDPPARRWECVLVPSLRDADLGLQCYETDTDTDPAVHGDCGWRDC